MSTMRHYHDATGMIESKLTSLKVNREHLKPSLKEFTDYYNDVWDVYKLSYPGKKLMTFKKYNDIPGDVWKKPMLKYGKSLLEDVEGVMKVPFKITYELKGKIKTFTPKKLSAKDFDNFTSAHVNAVARVKKLGLKVAFLLLSEKYYFGLLAQYKLESLEAGQLFKYSVIPVRRKDKKLWLQAVPELPGYVSYSKYRDAKAKQNLKLAKEKKDVTPFRL